MRALSKPIIFIFIIADLFLVGYVLLHNATFAVLEPQGMIAAKEHRLFLTAILLSLFGIIPTFVMTFFIVLNYRAGNKKAKYAPDWETSRPLQLAWWILIVLIIGTLGIITVKSTHELDPFRELTSQKRPLTIQVVALQWKWLFIYPEQNIATINYIVFPAKTPITFELTADAPMNSFWIPQLGGQMYAMAGMVNRTHLMANTTGEFKGSDAEISGAGFADMKFIAKATSPDEFSSWVQSVRNTGKPLDMAMYKKLAKPSENTPVRLYAPVQSSLYNGIIMKFMAPPDTQKMPEMKM